MHTSEGYIAIVLAANIALIIDISFPLTSDQFLPLSKYLSKISKYFGALAKTIKIKMPAPSMMSFNCFFLETSQLQEIKIDTKAQQY